MTGYAVFWAASLAGLVGFLAYWVRRLGRGHLGRMAAIASAAEGDRTRFEARRQVWAAEDAERARVREAPESVELGAGEAAPAGGGAPTAVGRSTAVVPDPP